MMIDIPASIGEIVDKITILQIKKENIQDKVKLKNVIFELELLEEKLSAFSDIDISKQMEMLHSVNKELWAIEDNIRQKEKAKEFDEEFIRLARLVYYTNDERANLKKEINVLAGSTLVEEKQYDDYK